MKARGATPEIEAPLAIVPAFPAAMPATCVPCSDWSGSNGSRAFRQVVDAGANARATMTLAVVNADCQVSLLENAFTFQ